MNDRSTPRRGFFTRVAATAVAIGGAGALGRLEAQGQAVDADRWLDKLTGRYRQVFDFNAHGDGIGLVHMHNFIETYRSAYGVANSEVNAIGTFYGGTTPLAWNDAMWAKYKIGAALQLTDPATKAPLTRNWFYRQQRGDPVFLNGLFPEANIESLSRRGATFLMCNTAFRVWVGRLAAGGAGTDEAIATDILANLVPGVVVVPAMVIAVNKAQMKGVAYMRS